MCSWHLIHINNQIKDTVVGIQKVLNSSMGVTKKDNPYDSNGVPNEYRNYAVSSDFLNRPLTFATYNHLITSLINIRTSLINNFYIN